MSDDFRPIRPKQVPLSHAEAAPRTVAGRGASVITWGLGLALAVGLLVLVFFLVPAWLADSRETTSRPPASTAVPAAGAGPTSRAPRTAQDQDEALPPYQQLKREQAREQAQEQLAEFVELQIELEKNMQVGAWGAEAYDLAKDQAAAGDEAFLREQFQASIDSYRAAVASLTQLIARGREVLETSLEDGAGALAERDQARAEAAFALAETIAPDDPRVASGKARTALLPEISTLMREARNQELAGDWNGAMETYRKVEDLDSATRGLRDAITRVEQGRNQAQVQQLLSQGFIHLEAERFAAASKAFRDALALDPGNTVAEGALEQVSTRGDVARINELRQQAEAAAAQERWQQAAELYGQVMDLDGTIQFAQSGRARALAQQRANAALAKIMQSPERLSSDRLYREAREILARAEGLEPRGQRLAEKIADVSTILEVYANPVPVLLRSDNLTEITLSTVGTLGSFTEKRLELRPGAYTVIGSRDGCRDVREQITVRPNMSPVDIRCAETL